MNAFSTGEFVYAVMTLLAAVFFSAIALLIVLDGDIKSAAAGFVASLLIIAGLLWSINLPAPAPEFSSIAKASAAALAVWTTLLAIVLMAELIVVIYRQKEEE